MATIRVKVPSFLSVAPDLDDLKVLRDNLEHSLRHLIRTNRELESELLQQAASGAELDRDFQDALAENKPVVDKYFRQLKDIQRLLVTLTANQGHHAAVLFVPEDQWTDADEATAAQSAIAASRSSEAIGNASQPALAPGSATGFDASGSGAGRYNADGDLIGFGLSNGENAFSQQSLIDRHRREEEDARATQAAMNRAAAEAAARQTAEAQVLGGTPAAAQHSPSKDQPQSVEQGSILAAGGTMRSRSPGRPAAAASSPPAEAVPRDDAAGISL